MPIRPNRTEDAIQLRDHALTIIRQHGTYQPISTGQKFLTWKGDSFGIWLRPPFQEWDYGPDVSARSLAATHGLTLDQAKYAAVLHGLTLPEVLPYCIDIFQARKLFSMEWADDGRTYIVSFRRGPWEAEFLSLRTRDAP
jgi:hypothetical protein